ncbi:4796_t:CDS:2, partial [Racocetra fulgida]
MFILYKINSYIYTGEFSDNNNVDLLDIFIAADEIQLNEVKQKVEKRLLETESAWKFPRDFITIYGLIEKGFQALSDPKPKSNLPKRELAYSFDSNIIEAKDAALIASWIDKKQGMPYRFNDMPFEFKLIYRASRENFSVDTFHKNCDYVGPTVVIIKVRNSNEIIGGYNPLDWSENDDYYNHEFKPTSKSFVFSLFSLSNGAIPRVSCVSSQKEAITWCTSRGPCFGFKDLWIEENTYNSQRSVVGTSKKHSYEKGIIDKETFGIEEYE